MKNIMRRVMLTLVVSSTLLATSSCRSVVGTYSNANGSFVLDLKSGGKASLTFLGESKPCTYTSDKQEIKLDCEDEKTVLTIHDDGSLSAGLIGVLKKSK